MRRVATVVILVAMCGICLAQRGSRGYRGPDIVMDRRGVPDWEIDSEHPEDVFTFVRIMFNGYGGWSWQTDYPDSDLNFSFRLQQLTSLKVNPNPIVLELTDPRLFDYPFIYFCEPGRSGLGLQSDEIDALRRYCENGGFVMFDDFWGEYEWDRFYFEIKKVFPDREPEDIPLEHSIFHCVYELDEQPQVPAINTALGGRHSGITWERADARTPHYRAIYDDDGRMMVIICHNTDLGDGWEREGENEWYFHEFSEKKAYPLGINIVFYAMTH